MKRIITMGFCLITTMGCGNEGSDEPSMTVSIEETPAGSAETENEPASPEVDPANSTAMAEPMETTMTSGPSAPPTALTEAFANSDPGPVTGCNGYSVSAIRGWMVDQDGRALAGALAQMCIDGAGDGPTTCLQPVETGPDGFFTITVPEGDRCAEGAVMRAVLVDAEKPPHAAMYCHLPFDELSGSTQLTITEPFRLYATSPAVSKPDLGDERASRRVDLGDGLTVDVVPYDIFGSEVASDYAALSAKSVPSDSPGLCFLSGDEDLDGLYAMSPDLPVLGEGVRVQIANNQGLASGSAVEFFILGGIDCELADGKAPEGDWVFIGTGSVSPDGSSIEGPAPLPCLTWLGYRGEPGSRPAQ